MASDIPYSQTEVLCSGRRFIQQEVLYSRRKYPTLASDSLLYSQIEVLCSGRRFHTVAGGCIQQKEVSDIDSGQWQNSLKIEVEVLYSWRRFYTVAGGTR